jgi:hypothetical protein
VRLFQGSGPAPTSPGPLGGYLSRLAALFDDPEVFVFLDDLLNAGFNVSRCMPRRDGEAFRSRSDLPPFSPRKSQADDPDAVVIDVWMCRVVGIDQEKLTPKLYAEVEAAFRNRNRGASTRIENLPPEGQPGASRPCSC